MDSSPQPAAAGKRERTRQLNDSLRKTLDDSLGKVVFTPGVAALESDVVMMVLSAIAAFDAFGPENDPHGEHDFGSFDLAGYTLFWKIDYYAPDLEGGSEDPSDPQQTTRVLTIMLAEEY